MGRPSALFLQAERGLRTVSPVCLGAPLGSHGGSQLRSPRASPVQRPLPCASQRGALCIPSASKLIAVETLNGTKTLQPDTTSNFHNEYTLGEFLGEGMFGVVRAAKQIATGAEVAVKLIPVKSQKESALRELQQEVTYWQQVMASKNVVQLYAVYQDSEHLYLVQEVCHGGDLQTLLEAQGPLNEAETAQAISGVLGMLQECHRHCICYGDVKPANFLIKKMYPCLHHIIDPSTPKGQIMIKATDFGCSQGSGTSARLQRVCGTPLFMAPEIFSRRYSHAVDVWAAGVLMYHLLSNRFPFWEIDSEYLNVLPQDTIQSSIMSGRVFFTGPMEAVSSEAKDLITSMLCRDPRKRITVEQALQHPWFKCFPAADTYVNNIVPFRA